MSFTSESIQRLFKVIADIESPEECQAFFEDLCTIRELQGMAQRLDIALLLNEGLNYLSISKQLDVSSTTISRVNRALTYGSDGYKKVIKKINEGKTDDN